MAKQKWLLVFCSLVVLVLISCRPALDSGADPTPSLLPTDVVAESDAPVQESTIALSTEEFDCSLVTEIPMAECQALVTLYEATNGPAWSDDGLPWEEGDTGWLGGDNPCAWAGVSCVNGHVDMLYLGNSGLQGRLPAGWAGLTALRVLDLHSNQIDGEIPASLGDLSTLEGLDLSANHLTGAVPSSLGRLTKLARLDLPHNNLIGAIPPQLGKLAALHTLDLAYNQLSGEVPAALADLKNLQSLRLNDNQLEGVIPAGLVELPELVEVNLAFNQLSGPVPAGLTAGITRALWGNRLDGTVDIRAGETMRTHGVQFTGDPTVATAVWPEAIPASAAEAWWTTVPDHVRLTLVRDDESLDHAPMGIQVPGEAQIQVYDISDQLYAVPELDQSAQEQVAALQALLASGQDVSGEEPLPLLPLTNAAQMFHARFVRIDFGNGSGIRYLTQYAQGPSPVTNDNLFYTFQGLTADGSRYVAAFFPASASFLPVTTQEAMALPEMEAFLSGTDSDYLRSTTQALNELSAENFDPPLSRIDELVRSLSVAAADVPAAEQGRWPEEGEAVDGEPVLQWEAFPGAAQYELVVVDDDAYPPVVAFSHTGSDIVVPVTPALAPGSYSWTVRAQDDDGNTLAELNSDFNVYVALKAVQPADLADVGRTPTLEWEPYAGAVTYEVTVVAGYPPVVVFATTTPGTSVTVSPPLDAADVHYWTVWAKDGNGRILAALSSAFTVQR